jgi:hypothetical protein
LGLVAARFERRAESEHTPQFYPTVPPLKTPEFLTAFAQI